MSEALLQPNETTRMKRKKKRKAISRGLIIGGSVLLWAGLFYGGIWLAKQYIKDTQSYVNQKILEVKVQNEEQVSMIRGELKSIQEELTAIKEELALTDQTIHGTNETRTLLQERISALDSQLAQLKTSLKQLEEATRVN